MVPAMHMLIITPAWRAVNRLLRRKVAINIFLQAAEGNPVGISYAFAVDCVRLQQAVGFLPSDVQDLAHGFDVYDVWVFLSQVIHEEPPFSLLGDGSRRCSGKCFGSHLIYNS